jgi:hypothetical protein
MAEPKVLARELKFRNFPNVTIGLQFSAKPVVITKAMKERMEKEALQKANEGGKDSTSEDTTSEDIKTENDEDIKFSSS